MNARNLALSLVSLLLCLALVEGALALAGFEPPDTGYFRRDARLGFVLEPGDYPEGIHINPDGYRGPDLLPPREGRVRIVTLGDSCTFGVNIPDESQTYSRVLERLLRERGLDAEVVNAGVPGYTSFQGTLLLPELERLRPDAITIYYGWNDHWLGGFLSDRAMVENPILLRVNIIASQSRVYHAMKRVLGVSRPPRAKEAMMVPLGLGGLIHRAESYRVPTDQYRENLEEIVTWSKKHRVRVILITAPEGIDRTGAGDAAAWRKNLIKREDSLPLLHAAYNDRVRSVADGRRVPLIDAAEILRRAGNEFFIHPIADPVHPAAAGHALIAEALADELGDLAPRKGPEEARAAAVDRALRRAGDWYLAAGDTFVCDDEPLDRSDAKYMWFLWRAASLSGDEPLKRMLLRAMNACARVDARYEVFERLLPPEVKRYSFGIGAQVALGIHEDSARWAVNCERYTLGDATRDRLLATRYLFEHAGNRLNRKSYALTHMLMAFVWFKQTEPATGVCAEPDLVDRRIREVANRTAWEHYTGLGNLGGYEGTRRRLPEGGARYAMQDITGQRIGIILESGHPELVRPEWLDHLVATQNPDGGWSPNEGQPSSQHTTMCAMWALAQARHTYAKELGYAR
ncbi:MAG: SGNH/GDSL hydrolase family protein [Deltaproteobacteria bacterium]|nr:SGNH/GDSL hydrolase family protein [Deltaproteobacteria bacterium]